MSYSLEAIAQLEHSKEFARLHQKFHQFNPLKVLRVDQFEIRHSNILAWLLDPNENHQMGSFFVKKLLSRLITRPENEDKGAGIDFLTYLHVSFGDVEVEREVKTHTNRYLDLLVHIPSQKLVLVIENKFHSGESVGQLENYLEYAQKRFNDSDYTILPVFLTLANAKPSEEIYWMLDYQDVLEIIELHLELNKESITDQIYDFLTFYTEVLREELVHDEESVQLALDVYETSKGAIDFLFLSQHDNFRKQARYEKVFQEAAKLSDKQKLSIGKIYEKKKKTIDFIFNIGSNVLREAFLTFVEATEIPAGHYKAHLQVPNFILPGWKEFQKTLGEPESGYWLGSGLITWFERTWDERLKINVEVGPIPFAERYQFLLALEQQGVYFRASAKVEGKKYTKIHTETVLISDWAFKQEIVEGMMKLYEDPALESVFKKIAKAVESMETQQEILMEQEVEQFRKSLNLFPTASFLKFCEIHGINQNDYSLHERQPSFVVPAFKGLEKQFGSARQKWWWHDGTFIMWFDRLKDERLKLTLELGPLEPSKRIALIEELESRGVSFSAKSKEQHAKYTRIYSNAKVIDDWGDVQVVANEMERLFNHPKNQELLKQIEEVAMANSQVH